MHRLILRRSVLLPLLTAALLGWSCTSAPTDNSQANRAQSNTQPAAAKAKTAATGTITATPNPIKVCDKTATGKTTLSWTTSGATDVEVRVGKPDGDLFAKTGPAGSWPTEKWVGNGMVFYLQDVSNGKPLTIENTIATVTAKVTSDGCP